MKNTLFLFSFILIIVLFTSGKGYAKNEKQDNRIINVIFDTDIGNDIDDVLALDMLYKYMDSGRLKILGIMNNKDSQYSTEFIDIMNTWYGYPKIPIGKLKDGVTIDDYVNYAQNVCKLEENGIPLFKRSRKEYSDLPDAHILYRKLLAKQPDHSVTIISVGFSTNLARLLETPADKYSSLTGKELVAKKVKLLSVMGGCFKTNPIKEFNIVNDIPSAQKLFAEWPGQIVVSPFDVGSKIQFPAKVIENDFNWGVSHPMVEGYLHYRPIPYDRATWDLTATLYATEPDSVFFNQSERGKIVVTNEGITQFNPSSNGQHIYLSVDNQQAQTIKDYFIRLITKKPKSIDKKKISIK